MAYEFNGTNQYLSLPSAVVNNVPLTVACWFNAANITSELPLICVNNSASTSRLTLIGRGDLAGDPIRFQINGQATSNANTTAGFSANIWMHACGVASSSTLRSVYLNGGSSQTNITSHTLTGLNQSSIGTQRLSGFPNGTGFMKGLIAEVGIWNADLTAAEIASLAKGMTCDKIRPQSLVFYAPLVRDLIDQKGGLTITNNNGATVATHPRVYA
jgi:hypothetical protein